MKTRLIKFDKGSTVHLPYTESSVKVSVLNGSFDYCDIDDCDPFSTFAIRDSVQSIIGISKDGLSLYYGDKTIYGYEDMLITVSENDSGNPRKWEISAIGYVYQEGSFVVEQEGKPE